MKIKIACVDDHQLFLEGLTKIIRSVPDFEIVGYYNSPKKFLHALNEMSVDVVTLDVEMPEINGLELCKKIKELNPHIKVLFISMFETLAVVNQVKDICADGFISKNTEAEEVFTAIKNVYGGTSHFATPLPLQKIITSVTPSAVMLTKREKQIILLIKDGKTSKEIAKELSISEYTVETHRKNIFKKLKLSSVQELIKFAYENYLK